VPSPLELKKSLLLKAAHAAAHTAIHAAPMPTMPTMVRLFTY
jgi:hypothetical protein